MNTERVFKLGWHPEGRNQRVHRDDMPRAVRVEGDAILVDHDGAIVAVHRVLEGETADAVARLGRTLHSSAVPWNDINSLSGSGRLSGIKYPNVTFGTVAPQPLRRRYGCRAARLHEERPDLVGALADLFVDVWEEFERHAPERAEETMSISAAAVHDDWRFCDTPWTSGIINHTAALPYHKDARNLPQTWSAMVMCKKGCDGGELVLPEYGVSLACPDKSLLLFDGQATWHGVTPFKLRNRFSYRYSIVMYAKADCGQCGPAHSEAARAARVATEHDRHRETVLDQPPKRTADLTQGDITVALDRRSGP